MGEKRRLIFLVCVGLLMIAVTGILDVQGKVNMFVNFVGAVIAFSINVAIKLMINQHIEAKQYKLINLLAMNNMIKLLILILYFYFRINLYHHYLEGAQIARLMLEYTVLEFMEIMLVLSVPLYREENRLSIGTLLMPIVIVFFICKYIPDKHIISICTTINSINIVMSIITYCQWKGTTYCKMYLFFKMLYFLMMPLVHPLGNERYFFMISFVAIQSFSLLEYVYQRGLSDPWRKKVEALNEAEKMIHRQGKNCNMIVDLSHELKTPVNVIRSGLDILALDYAEDKIILEEVKSIKKDCNQMMNIIQDMIDIQKMKSNHIQVKYHTYNLVEVVENVVDAFSEEIEESPFVFNPIEEEIYEDMDVTLIQQCFMLLFQFLIKQDLKSQLYVEIGKIKDTEEVYILIRHSKVKMLQDMDYPMEENQNKNNVAETLSLQVVNCILQLHKVQLQYEEKNNIKMIFPRCNTTTDEWLDESCINFLKDQMKARDIVS